MVRPRQPGLPLSACGEEPLLETRRPELGRGRRRVTVRAIGPARARETLLFVVEENDRAPQHVFVPGEPRRFFDAEQRQTRLVASGGEARRFLDKINVGSETNEGEVSVFQAELDGSTGQAGGLVDTIVTRHGSEETCCCEARFLDPPNCHPHILENLRARRQWTRDGGTWHDLAIDCRRHEPIGAAHHRSR